ncbi:hypothetical protein PLICRDRAFT_288452 [Plicaturopsis crispa FD-325 SS-3]|nr:hypothetical protein PLICRDRAFT_288452 [Plicaturopsis crispa FD-325 SS-3]
MQRRRTPTSSTLFLICICGFLSLLRLPVSLGALVNGTIDDKFGDARTGAQWAYLPDGAWNDGTNCPSCTAQPAASQAFMGSWHDGTFNVLPGSNNFPNQTLSASVNFNGTAVYVYCIVAHSASGPDGNMDLTFFIDGNTVGTFTLAPTGAQPNFSYNVSVFSMENLEPKPHNFTVQNGHVNGLKALAIIDYLQYTCVSLTLKTTTRTY